VNPAKREALFLTLEEVLSLHADQIERYGGTPGLRDAGLLSSALAMPQASFSGNLLHSTVHEMAAAYLFHLTQDHPFLDGNKRIGLAATLAFLGLNDLELRAEDGDLFELVMGVAQGLRTKAEIAVFLQRHCCAI
jgi:death on curing protein